MRMIQEREFHTDHDTAIVLGKFDGIHLGHQRLLEELQKEKKNGLATVVFTFMPLPDAYFGRRNEGMISTYEERREIFESYEIDELIEFPMNDETARIPAEIFIEEYFVKRLHVKCVIAGEDVSFGYRGIGNRALLETMGKQFGFRVRIIEKRMFGDTEISSSYVRSAIRYGNMELVKQLLGRNFCLSGIVVRGNQIGRTLDMPTVNLPVNEERLLPPDGVYFSECECKGIHYHGISNLGVKPTIGGGKPRGLETYLFSCNEELYDEHLSIELLRYARKEQTFASLEDLKNQLMVDREAAEVYFGQ